MNTNSKPLNAYGELAGDIREILITSEQIQERIQQIGALISVDYAGKTPILIGVLKGVLFFMADLLRTVTIHVEVDFLAVSSYTPSTRDQGLVRLIKDLDISIENRHVLFVEDIVDSGLTLNYLMRNLRARQPASLEACVLFNKPENRLIHLPLNYVGFDLPNRFIVGYGLDHRERFRNLPFIGLLKPDAL